ncbi:MAG: hypothetical protein HYV63_07405 [Candidatus Schekmanbacteria bacterium]|nr:hypothetical protein [Candidatus Schekmanbacteria bacterium]
MSLATSGRLQISITGRSLSGSGATVTRTALEWKLSASPDRAFTKYVPGPGKTRSFT